MIVVTTENHECSVHYLLRLRSLSRWRTTSALFIVCYDPDRCHDGEPRVLCSLFAPTEIAVTTENHECSVHCLLRPRSLSRRRTTSALFIVCSVIVLTTENQECSVHCLLCDRCHDGELRVLCSLFAPTEIVVTMENHECSVHCLLCDRCHDGEPRVLCSLFAL